jgi:hypothetical protein
VTHVLRIAGGQSPADVPAACLAFSCRLGDDTTVGLPRQWRDELADAVGPGGLADLLRAPGPVRVEWVPDLNGRGGQYEIRPA